MRLDVHQHLWTEELCSVLARRTSPPRLVREGEGWSLLLAGEPPTSLGRLPADPGRRAATLPAEGVDVALVALSAALGIEALPGGEAREVLDAWHRDTDRLPSRLAAWGSLPLADATPADVDALLERGRVGICLPAGALASPALLDLAGPLLERLERSGAPLFVHPGPAPGAWLAALTAYPAGLNAAWHAWQLHGRAVHPRLRVLFAALAGLAPLQLERLAARGHRDAADRARSDALTFYDTSSYGPDAIEAVARAVGPGALVHGSDWPWAEPCLPGTLYARALLQDNPAALLRGERPEPAAAWSAQAAFEVSAAA